jgi:ribosome-associated protein
MSQGDGTERPSKSARKREMAALLALAERMTQLSDADLARLEVDAALREALDLARRMKSSGARNRQLRHCVHLMDTDELAPVRAFLDNRHAAQVGAKRRFHEAERWRDRLVAEGDTALDALLVRFSQGDRQQARQLVLAAQREQRSGKPAGAGRRLFRWLRPLIDAQTPKK